MFLFCRCFTSRPPPPNPVQTRLFCDNQQINGSGCFATIFQLIKSQSAGQHSNTQCRIIANGIVVIYGFQSCFVLWLRVFYCCYFQRRIQRHVSFPPSSDVCFCCAVSIVTQVIEQRCLVILRNVWWVKAVNLLLNLAHAGLCSPPPSLPLLQTSLQILLRFFTPKE